jgi:branched-chain amino acid transport system permease protein
MSSSTAAPVAAAQQVPKAEFDWRPLALLAAVMLVALPAVGSGSTWLTLTAAGLAMGFIVFIIASGLTLVFGLMDVLNFGHGVFIALGAFVATSVMGATVGWTGGLGQLGSVFVAIDRKSVV